MPSQDSLNDYWHYNLVSTNGNFFWLTPVLFYVIITPVLLYISYSCTYYILYNTYYWSTTITGFHENKYIQNLNNQKVIVESTGYKP